MAKKSESQKEEKALEEEIVEDNVVAEEKKAQKLSEVDELSTPEHNISGQEVDIEDVKEETGTKEEVAPEVSAINADTEIALEADAGNEPKKQKKSVKKAAKKPRKELKPKKRSKQYLQKAEKLDHKIHPLSEAIDAVKQMSYSKFDGTISLVIRVEKGKKAEDAPRGTIRLPHGTGKTLKVKIATEEIIEKIKKGQTDFDILVASPEIMPQLGVVAKILGPKGKMPNPKDGTVVENPKEAVEELKSNIVRYRSDSGNNFHIPVGKVSWDKAKIEENLKTVFKSFARFKIASATLSATMGPGVKVEVSKG